LVFCGLRIVLRAVLRGFGRVDTGEGKKPREKGVFVPRKPTGAGAKEI